MNEIDTDPASKLSQLQKNILLALLRKEDPAIVERSRRGHWTASERAVFSRALNRLRQRELIEQTQSSTGRLKGIALTPSGREIAEDLQQLIDWSERIIRQEKERERTGQLPAFLQSIYEHQPKMSQRQMDEWASKMLTLISERMGLPWPIDVAKMRSLSQKVSRWGRRR